MAGLRAKISTRGLPNTKQERQTLRYDVSLSYITNIDNSIWTMLRKTFMLDVAIFSIVRPREHWLEYSIQIDFQWEKFPLFLPIPAIFRGFRTFASPSLLWYPRIL